MLVNGRKIAKEILADVKVEGSALGPLVVRAVTVAPSPETLSYLSIKKKRASDAGMQLALAQLPDDASEEDVIEAIGQEGADAVIVQLPLPAHLDRERVLAAIPLDKDADVLAEGAYRAFELGEHGALMPPVADAVREILERSGTDIRGKSIVIVGNGRLVGQPVYHWLASNGLDAQVVTREDADRLEELLPAADVIVSGAGAPGIITPGMLKAGVVLIDAGTSESDGAIVGDADPACAEIASIFTPVPGGVGPIAVACLFRNALELAKRRRLQTP